MIFESPREERKRRIKFDIGDMIYLYWYGTTPEEEDYELLSFYTPALAIVIDIEYNGEEYGNYYTLKIIYEDRLSQYYIAYNKGIHMLHESAMQRKAKICAKRRI